MQMLGVTSLGKFYIYYAAVQNPQLLAAKEIPSTMANCTNHAISPNGTYVAVTCIEVKNRRHALLTGKLDGQDSWHNSYSKLLVPSNDR